MIKCVLYKKCTTPYQSEAAGVRRWQLKAYTDSPVHDVLRWSKFSNLSVLYAAHDVPIVHRRWQGLHILRLP